MPELKNLVDHWVLIAQGLIGSIGALALATHWRNGSRRVNGATLCGRTDFPVSSTTDPVTQGLIGQLVR